MQHIILQGITLEDFLQHIEKTIEKKVNEKLDQLKQKEKWVYITRKEASEALKITLPTLHNYIKEGKITSYRIGTRVLLRSDDIETAVIKRKFR
jgi:excisionase family DNA binding protein